MSIFSKLFGKRTSASLEAPPDSHSQQASFTAKLPGPALKVPSPDWRTNPFHLMLLERFLDAGSVDRGVPEYWATSLQESPQSVVQRFMADGLLMPVPLVRAVEYSSSGVELKALAKARGLKLSGRKEELAQRLVDADPDSMTALFKDKRVVTCSAEAREVVEQYREQRRIALDNAVTAVRSALEAQDFQTAIEIAQRYMASEVKIETTNPLEIRRPEITLKEQIASLQRIYSVRPRILKELPEEDWKPLITVVAMGNLLGRMPTSWLPDSFKGVEKFDHEVALRMVQFHLKHLDDVAKFRTVGVTKVKVLDCGGGSCAACVKMAAGGKLRKLDSVPELPYEHCTCHLGCRCIMVADI